MSATTTTTTGRFGPLGDRNFRLFFVGYSTSLFGTGMEMVALAFAVLGSGGSTADLGLVVAAGVVVNVVCLLAGGVVADRFPRRAVMIASDVVRVLAEGALAVVVLAGQPPVWLLVVLYAVHNVGYGFFTPAAAGLTPELLEEHDLHRANVLIGFARDIGTVGGPAVAGVLIGVVGPGLVLAVDAGTYAVSVLALALLRVPRRAAPAGEAEVAASTPLRDLVEGFAAWRAQAWIWMTSIACSLFNAFVYAPFIVLGPAVAQDHLDGSHSWGLIVAAQGLGSVAVAAVLMRWTPTRPVLSIVASLATWVLPDVCLALVAPVPLIAASAFLGGAGLAVMAAVWTTLLQRRVARDLISRVASVDAVVSYSLSPIGLVVAAAVAVPVGAQNVLLAAAVFQGLMTVVLLAVPAAWMTLAPARSPDSRTPDPQTPDPQPASEGGTA